MSGTSEGSRKAAETRGSESLREAGRRGAETLNADQNKKSEASHKAADTRKANDPDAFKKMGEKGGSHSQSGGSSSQGRKQDQDED